MKFKPLICVAALLLAGLAACNEPDRDAQPTSNATQDAPVDRDPTPQTGTGGDSQNKSPDGTTTGAPVTTPEKPAQ